jgi:hypothetical protein
MRIRYVIAIPDLWPDPEYAWPCDKSTWMPNVKTLARYLARYLKVIVDPTLRHTTFVGLRDDKDPRKVVRET